MMTQPPEHSAPSPRHIAAGLGHATRQEICGMLAMQDAARISQIAGSLSDAARRKLASDAGPAVDRIAAFATGLMDGPIPTHALRAWLWLTLKEALGLPGLYPLSTRGLESEAAAIAVRASQILAASVAKARQEKEDAGASALGRSGRNLPRAASGPRRRARAAVTFPDIVAHELAVMMESLAEADGRGELDPEVAAAIRKGQRAMSAAALAGGGWVALAAAVGGAGFAPYLAAAKLSAVIPFVAGPTLTSLLFVMINPVTVIAGTATLGYWAVKGQGAAARQIAAARIATLLAVRGRDAGDGMAALLDAFRSLHRMADKDLPAWLIIDLSIRGSLATAGQAGGAALGLLVIGPASALILGPVAGVAALFGTGMAHDLLDRGIRREWHADVIKAAQDAETALLHARTRQVAALRTRLARLRAVGGNLPHQLRGWLEARMADDLIAAIEAKGQVLPASSLRAAMEVLVQASSPDIVDPAVLRARHHLTRCIAEKPSTTSALRELGTRAGNTVLDHERKE